MIANTARAFSAILWTLFILCHHALADTSVSTIIEFPMDSNPGWSAEGQWEFGVPLGNRGDPTSGFTGTNVYGYNLQGDYANNMPRYWLTTTAIDCSGYHDVTLSFYRWLSIENANFDGATIEVSNDGSTWHTVWSHDSIEIQDASWQHISYNISHIADAESTVFIRWGIGPTDSLSKGAGWNIDDVMLEGVLADPLDISPVNTWEVYGQPGGPFAPDTKQFTLTNTSTEAISWSATASASWLALTPTNGTLDAASSTKVVLSILSSATNLAEGVHQGTLVFSNLTSGQIHRRNMELTVQPMPGSIVNAAGYSQTLNLDLDSDTSSDIDANSDASIGVLMMRTMYNDIFKSGIGEAILPLTNTYSGSLGTNNIGSSGMPADNSDILVDNGGILEINSSDSETLGENLSGPVTLVKSGAGTLTLSGSKSYTGETIVHEGTLFLDAGSSTGSGDVIVKIDGTLAGSGTVNANATISGMHAPGGTQAGLMAFAGDLTYEAGAQIMLDFFANSSEGRGTSYDGIDVGGNLDFNGATKLVLRFNGPGSTVDWTDEFWASNQSIKIFDIDGYLLNMSDLTILSANWLDAFGNDISAVREHGMFSLRINGNEIFLDYSDIMSLASVPEPIALSLLILCSGTTLCIRRFFCH